MCCSKTLLLSLSLFVSIAKSSILQPTGVDEIFEEIVTRHIPNSVVIASDNGSFQLLINGTSVPLELVESENHVVTEEILVITKDRRGRNKISLGDLPTNCHFRSKSPLVSAALSNCTDSLKGLIIMGNQTYVIDTQSSASKTSSRRSQQREYKRLRRTLDKDALNFCGLNSNPLLVVNEDVTSDQVAETGESLGVLKYKTDEPTVELGVFADQQLYAKFVAKHGAADAEAKLQDFLVTVIHNVQMLYKQPGLVPNVNFKIVRMEIFKAQPEQLQANQHSSGDASSYLELFCHYQTDRPDRNFDHGLLFTGYDIHRGDDYSISGISKLGGVCHLTQACTLAEGLDFTSVYITAHELGHSLGMKHDEPACGSGYIMSGSLGPGKVTWSDCSQTEFSKFQERLNSFGKNCMMAAKHDATVALPDVKPGQKYNADQQCELIHGTGYKQMLTKRYTEELSCSMLWCSKPDSGRIITSHPALEGTTCGTNKFCNLGKCVPSDVPITFPPAVNGGWGRWTTPDCTNCICPAIGEGISLVKSTRSCDSPTPQNGGTTCSGQNLRGIVCAAPCSSANVKNLQSYLDDICTKLRDLKPGGELTGTGVQLNKTPKRACKVFCTVKSESGSSAIYRTYNDLIPDGSPCGAPGEEKFCLDGNCLPLSCNKKGLVEDSSDCPTTTEECAAPTTVPTTTLLTTLPPTQATEISKSGSWDSWATWSSCSRTCGEGKRTRKRNCIGTGCSGSPEESETCNVAECAAMSEWSSWSECSVTCEKGVQLRHRTCHGSGTCDGHFDEKKNCRLDDCPVWSEWDSWSGCSVTCDNGNRVRSRNCLAGSCTGSNKEAEACAKAACNSGPPTSIPLNSPAPTGEKTAFWNEWQQWSPCNCGNPGIQKRSRTCSGSSCVGISEESQTCRADKIFCSEKWASWSEWSSCTETCGYSVRRRTRSCLGDSCPGVADMTDVCNTKECPKATSSDTANWSEWGNWAYCSVTCGSGTKIRRRYCLKSECSGDTEEKTSCTAESPCKPVWSAWSRWSDCRPHCGQSSQTRFRTCLTPGLCDASDTEEQTCVYQKCDEDSVQHLSPVKYSDWSEWSSCSNSCGQGTKSRTKKCIETCLSSDSISETIGCYHDCDLGNWLAWNEWTECTKSCGTGWKRRTRNCSANKCGDNMSEHLSCNTQPCNQ